VDDAGDGTPTRASLRHNLGHRTRVADVHGQIAGLAAGTADGLQGAADLAHRQDGGHAAAQLGRAGGLAPGFDLGQKHALELGITLDPATAHGLVFHGRATEQEETAAGRARQLDHAGSGHTASPAGNHHHRLRIERQRRERGQGRRHRLQYQPRSLDGKAHFVLHAT